MADDVDSSVSVTGNLEGFMLDDFELFFESQRFCPNGGDVKEVKRMSKNCVKVTFLDSKVVGRLEKHLTMPGAVHITVEPFVSAKCHEADEVSARPEVTEDDSDNDVSIDTVTMVTGPESCSSDSEEIPQDKQCNTQSNSVVKELSENEGFTSLNSSVASIVGSDDDLCSLSIDGVGAIPPSLSRTNPDLGRRSFMSKPSGPQADNFLKSFRNSFSVGKANHDHNRKASLAVSYKHQKPKSQSPFMNSRAASLDKIEFQSSKDLLALDRHNSSGYVPSSYRDCGKESSDFDLFEEVHGDLHSDDENSNFLLSKSRIKERQDELMTASKSKIVEEISFSSEKFKLIKLVVDANGVGSGCCLKFDEHQLVITVEGLNDADVTSTKFQLHEIALFSANSRVKIPQQAQKLLLSKRGREWIVGEFTKKHLLSVFYTKDNQAHVISDNEATLQQTCELVEKTITSQNIPFDDSATTFLQSSTWLKTIETIESANLISIDTDYSQKIVAVSGCADDVKTCCQTIQELVRTNSKKTQCIKEKLGVVRLLKNQAHSIANKINQDLSSRVQLEFDYQKGTILVSGHMDDVEKAAKCLKMNYINAVCYDKYEVNKQGLTLEMFTSKNNPGSDLIDLLELRDNCVIEVRGNSSRAGGGAESDVDWPVERVEVKSAKNKKIRVRVEQGNIVEYDAEVLVNTIANRTLERGGVINQCFLRAGGSRLYQELRRSFPQDFGRDVVTTSAGEKMNAEFIFHAAIRKYRNQESLDRLYDMIKKCLDMADKKKVRSIAFPTIGCGKLGYAPKDVADCFTQAIKKTRTDLQISIVAFEDHLAREFKTHLAHSHSESSNDNESKEGSWFGGRIRQFFGSIPYMRKMHVSNQIVFHINAMSDDVLQRVRGTLASKISEMVTESPIKDEAISDLSDEAEAKIYALRTSEVDIKIDRARQTITLKGIKSQVEHTKMKVLHLVYKEGARNEGPQHFQLQSSFRFPRHWSLSRKGSGTPKDCLTTEISPQSQAEIYQEVSSLVMKTWEANKVGHGSDAQGLGQHTIKIRKILCVENSPLYRKYMNKREEVKLGASVNRCPSVKGLQGERQIMTQNFGLKRLDAQLDHSINECYLLHGTKDQIVGSIQFSGLDSRLSGAHVLFGQGTYLTESSTKADQYADSKTQRKPKGSPLYMYVCRVILGNVFICQSPKPFKRPPCMQCFNDICVCAPGHSFAGNFDSVIGTHKAANTRLLFREFVIYHPEQSYPEFLVEYDRQ